MGVLSRTDGFAASTLISAFLLGDALLFNFFKICFQPVTDYLW
jgi:hypothetical protein